MFKIIGAAVVYGFALLGLAKYLEATSREQEPAADHADNVSPLCAVRP